jgi:hypothetical protein
VGRKSWAFNELIVPAINNSIIIDCLNKALQFTAIQILCMSVFQKRGKINFKEVMITFSMKKSFNHNMFKNMDPESRDR